MSDVNKLYRRFRDAEKAYHEGIREAFPLSKGVTWIKGRSAQCGRVVAHSHDSRVKVLNENTGKAYWLDAYWLRP